MKTIVLILSVAFGVNAHSQINAPGLLRKNKVHTIIGNSFSSNTHSRPSEIHTFIDSLGFKVKKIDHTKNDSNDSTITFYKYDDRYSVIGESTTSNYGYSYEYIRIDTNTYVYRTAFQGQVFNSTEKTTYRGKKTYINDTLKNVRHLLKQKKNLQLSKVIYYHPSGHRTAVTREKRLYNKADQCVKITTKIRRTSFLVHEYKNMKKRYLVRVCYFYYPDGLLKQVTDYHSSDHATVTTNYTYLKRE